MEKVELTEYRHNKNFVRVGDPVKVKPHGSTAFATTVRRITELANGTIEVEVIDPRTNHFRTVTPARVTRKAVTKAVSA